MNSPTPEQKKSGEELKKPGLETSEKEFLSAVKSNHLRTVQLLLDAGADVHVKNQRGFTALSLARSAGNEAIISYLRAAGAEE